MIFQKYIASFFSDVFFPEIDRRGVKHIAHLGDLVERRKYINFFTAWNLHNSLIKPIAEREDVEAIFLAGNHDEFFKDESWLNCVDVLYGNRLPSNIRFFLNPTTINFAGVNMDLYPWINPSNAVSAAALMEAPGADIALGHFELAGFPISPGVVMQHGQDAATLKSYRQVFSGHYHEESSQGNVKFLGTQYPLTWAEADSLKGFHIYDTETGELEFVHNPNSLFVRTVYDGELSLADNCASVISSLTGKIIKVSIRNKDRKTFDDYADFIEKQSPFQVQFLEERQITAEDLDFNGADDMLNILIRAPEIVESQYKEELGVFLHDLYNEALSVKIAE